MSISLAKTRLNTLSHREDNRIDFAMASYCLSALFSFFMPTSVTRQTSSPRAWRCACISTFHRGKPVPSKNGALSVLIPSPDIYSLDGEVDGCIEFLHGLFDSCP